jgi:hypothetical protein
MKWSGGRTKGRCSRLARLTSVLLFMYESEGEAEGEGGRGDEVERVT